jgi:5'(3')-deoxyribonucleotidase
MLDPIVLMAKSDMERRKSLENTDPQRGSGKRYNTGKTRHGLTPAYAQEQYARVLSIGAEKYGERNWEKGMNWSTVMDSLKRHINAFESGEDYDPETGLLHMAHVMCNAAFLCEYYKIYPQGDDRRLDFLSPVRIGLDIDEVLADWVAHYSRTHSTIIPSNWNFDRKIGERLAEVAKDKEFWMSIPPKTLPEDIQFEPCCYITSRVIPTEWTEEWLDLHGYPAVPVITVGHDQSKVEVAKAHNVDIFVDDRYENFVEMNNAGIFTYLFDAPHNQRYNVGHRRIKSLKEITI